MTMIFTTVTSDLIVLTVDSALTTSFGEGEPKAYDVGKVKSYVVEGVGVVATWGDHTGNRIRTALETQPIPNDIDQLIERVSQHLSKWTDEGDPGEVGYHVTGFSKDGEPQFAHIYWPGNPTLPCEHDHVFTVRLEMGGGNPIGVYYNGRDDIGSSVVDLLLRELTLRGIAQFNLAAPLDRSCFGDFVVRLASEITPEVGVPITTYLINKNNKIYTARNERLSPIDREKN